MTKSSLQYINWLYYHCKINVCLTEFGVKIVIVLLVGMTDLCTGILRRECGSIRGVKPASHLLCSLEQLFITRYVAMCPSLCTRLVYTMVVKLQINC